MLSQEYLTNPRMSQSRLKYILDGVDVFKWHNNDNAGTEPTESMLLGTTVHLMVLQPELINKIVKVPKYNSSTREGKIFKLLLDGKKIDFFPIAKGKTKKQEKDQFYEVDAEELQYIINTLYVNETLFNAAKDSLFISEEIYAKATKMTKAVLENEDAYTILKACTEFEQVYFYDYRGIEFKAQLDGKGYQFIKDLKTTNIPNGDFEIEREIKRRRYHFQAASYLHSVGGDVNWAYYITFVLNEPPHTVFPIQLSKRLLEEGMYQFDKACDIYNDCLKNNPEFKSNIKLRII